MDEHLRALERRVSSEPGDLSAGEAFAAALERHGDRARARAEWGRLARLGLEGAWAKLEPPPPRGLVGPPSSTRTRVIEDQHFWVIDRLEGDLLAGCWGDDQPTWVGRLDPATFEFRWAGPAGPCAALGPNVVRARGRTLEWVDGVSGHVIASSALAEPPRGDLPWVPADPPAPARLWAEADRIVVALEAGVFVAYQTFAADPPGGPPLHVSPIQVHKTLEHHGAGTLVRWDTEWNDAASRTARHVFAEDADTGRVVWVSPVRAEVLACDRRGALLRAQRRAGADERPIFAASPVEGAPRWTAPQVVHPAWMRQTADVYLFMLNGLVRALERDTGAVRWSWEGAASGALVVGFEVGAAVVYAVIGDVLVALDLDRGTELARTTLRPRHLAVGSTSKIEVVPLERGLLLCSRDEYRQHTPRGGSLVTWLDA